MISMEEKLTVLKNSVYSINCALSAIDCDNCIEVLEENLSRIYVPMHDVAIMHLFYGHNYAVYRILTE